MNYNVLLQHVVIFERLLPRSEKMNVLDGCVIEEQFAEWLIIRSVAKASWDDRDDLATILHQKHNERGEGRIEIHGFNSHLAKRVPMSRLCIDLFIGRIDDRVSIARWRGALQL